MNERTRGRVELLEALVEAEEALLPDRESFRITGVQSNAGAIIYHPKLERDRWPRQDIEDLADGKLVRLRKESHRQPPIGELGKLIGPTKIEVWHLDVTDAGHEEIKNLREAAMPSRQAPAGPSLGGLDWKRDVLPVLRAVYMVQVKTSPERSDIASGDVCLELGLPPDDSKTARVLHELEKAGFIEGTISVDQLLAPVRLRQTEKGLQVTAGWPRPGEGDIAERLLEAIEAAISMTPDGDERSKLVRLRDAVAGISREVLVSVFTRVATHGVDDVLS